MYVTKCSGDIRGKSVRSEGSSTSRMRTEVVGSGCQKRREKVIAINEVDNRERIPVRCESDNAVAEATAQRGSNNDTELTRFTSQSSGNVEGGKVPGSGHIRLTSPRRACRGDCEKKCLIGKLGKMQPPSRYGLSGPFERFHDERHFSTPLLLPEVFIIFDD